MMHRTSKEKSHILSKNFQVLKLVFKFCPPMKYLAIFYIIANIIISLTKVYLVSSALKKIATGIVFKDILLTILFILVIELFALGFKIIYEEYFEVKYRNIYIKNIQTYLFSKVKEIDMEEYDNPTFYNRFSRALRDSQWRGFGVYKTFLNFITSVSVTIALGTYIIINDIILITIIILSAIIIFIVNNKTTTLWYNIFKETEPENRFYWYINRTFYQQRYAAELKTTDISNLLIDKYYESAIKMENKYYRIEKKMTVYQSVGIIARNIFQEAGSYIYLGCRLFGKIGKQMPLTIDSFSSLVNATMQFFNNFMTAGLVFVNLREHALYIDDFLWIINYVPKIENNQGKKVDEFRTISVKNLTFKYNNSDKNVISNLSFELKRGDKIAIVGSNGSGKTTLTKLLLKFYNPSYGTITYNDYNYSDLNVGSLRKHLSVIFQDYQVYAISIAENILMRKIEPSDEEKIWKVLELVGLDKKIKKLPQGIYTKVTKEFDQNGITLSGGERQRLVIARVLANDADIYILDEPTAALDPLAEEKINKLILNIAQDKTVIIIAHRLSTVVDADRIYLLKDGSFIENGNHHELLLQNGEYAKMFNTQKSLYEKHHTQ